MNDEIKEILDYFQKDVDKYEETINNISQHKRHINTKILIDYITNLQQENQKYKEVIDKACQCIKDFLCSEEYINVDGDAIANNYKNILNILKGE